MQQQRYSVRAALLTTLLVALHSGCFAYAPSEMDLYPTFGAEDTVITLSGADISTASTIYCRFASFFLHHLSLTVRGC